MGPGADADSGAVSASVEDGRCRGCGASDAKLAAWGLCWGCYHWSRSGRPIRQRIAMLAARRESAAAKEQAAAQRAARRCQRPGCEAPLPRRRQKYCSDRCKMWVKNHSPAAVRARAAYAQRTLVVRPPRVCARCGLTRPHRARRLCQECYDKMRRSGRLADWPAARPRLEVASVAASAT